MKNITLLMTLIWKLLPMKCWGMMHLSLMTPSHKGFLKQKLFAKLPICHMANLVHDGKPLYLHHSDHLMIRYDTIMDVNKTKHF